MVINMKKINITEINKRLSAYIKKIKTITKSENFLLLGVLPGSLVIINDLLSKINTIQVGIDFIFKDNIANHNFKNMTIMKNNIILVVDILEEEKYLSKIIKNIQKYLPKSINIFAIYKNDNFEKQITYVDNIDWLCHGKSNKVFGYGITNPLNENQFNNFNQILINN